MNNKTQFEHMQIKRFEYNLLGLNGHIGVEVLSQNIVITCVFINISQCLCLENIEDIMHFLKTFFDFIYDQLLRGKSRQV